MVLYLMNLPSMDAVIDPLALASFLARWQKPRHAREDAP
jgi:hypothetical protein